MPESNEAAENMKATSQLIENHGSPVSSKCSKETAIINPSNIKSMNYVQSSSSPTNQTSGSSSGQALLSVNYTTVSSGSAKVPNVIPEDASRHITKLKRFLNTLQKFSNGISPEVGDQVKQLIIDLIVKSLNIEEFNLIISQLTSFPFKPFVVPFLKYTLPYLRRYISQMAQFLKIAPQQYLHQNDFLVVDQLSGNCYDAVDIFNSELNENGKRKLLVDRQNDSGYLEASQESHSPTAKRHSTIGAKIFGQNRYCPISPVTPTVNQQLFQFEDVPRDMRRERLLSEHKSNPGIVEKEEDEWKNIYTMLNCILGMVDKTKKALAILQERNCNIVYPEKDQCNRFSRNPRMPSPLISIGIDSKKMKLNPASRESQFANPSPEDLISDRHPEEIVKDLKVQAVVELRRAVAAAEAKASKLVANERLRMEKLIDEARQQAAENALMMANKQQESTENCWNCGRKASETCSGCNTARYCGSFCQHKDWENHHKVCRKNTGLKHPPATSTSSMDIISSTHSTNSDQEYDKDVKK